MSEIVKYIQAVVHGENLSEDDTARAFQIMTLGGATPAQIAALLTAFNAKGETIEEITGAAKLLLAKAIAVKAPENTINIAGTSDDFELLDVYTCVSFVVAGCGAPVALQGAGSVTARSTPSDILKLMGVNINASSKNAEEALKETNLCFMLASRFHSSVRELLHIHAELGIKTIFDIILPLCSPVAAPYQLIGLTSSDLATKLIQIIKSLGRKRAWVLHNEFGTGYLSLSGQSFIHELNDGKITTRSITPEDAGLESREETGIGGGDVIYNAQRFNELLHGKQDDYRDIILLNAAAALMVNGMTSSLTEGVILAAESIDSGKAKAILTRLVEISNR